MSLRWVSCKIVYISCCFMFIYSFCRLCDYAQIAQVETIGDVYIAVTGMVSKREEKLRFRFSRIRGLNQYFASVLSLGLIARTTGKSYHARLVFD